MHFLTVVSCINRLEPKATIVAPIKLLQHNRVHFNVMLNVQLFIAKNLPAAATFSVFGRDKGSVVGCAGWSTAMSSNTNFIIRRKEAHTTLVGLVSKMLIAMSS